MRIDAEPCNKRPPRLLRIAESTLSTLIIRGEPLIDHSTGASGPQAEMGMRAGQSHLRPHYGSDSVRIT